MKLTNVILAIFLLGLNLLPCDDAIAEESCSQEIHFHTDEDAGHDADADFCSPFCQCNCCQTLITNSQFVAFSSELTFLPLSNFAYSTNLDKEFIDSLLQPPQV